MRAIQQNSKISDNPDLEKYNESNEKKNKSDKKISKITKKNMRNKINVDEISQTYLIKKNKSKTVFHSFQYIIFLILFFPILSDQSLSLTIDNTGNSYVSILYFKNIGLPSHIYLTDTHNSTDIDIAQNDEFISLKCNLAICNVTLLWSDTKLLHLINASFLFAGCNKITNIDFYHFTPNNILYMSNMFQDCTSLNSIINLSIKSTTDFSYMFFNCTQLNNIQNFQILNDENSLFNMEYMFAYCTELQSIYINIKNEKNYVEKMNSIFENCTQLKDITFNEKLYIDNITNMSFMFSGCNALDSLNLSNLFIHEKNIANKLVDMSSMFSDCISLKNLNFDILKKLKPNDMSSMFYDCLNITYLNISGFETE